MILDKIFNVFLFISVYESWTTLKEIKLTVSACRPLIWTKISAKTRRSSTSPYSSRLLITFCELCVFGIFVTESIKASKIAVGFSCNGKLFVNIIQVTLWLIVASFNEALRGFLKYRSPRAYVITEAKIIFTVFGGIQLNSKFWKSADVIRIVLQRCFSTHRIEHCICRLRNWINDNFTTF